jgi:hypothetical protein
VASEERGRFTVLFLNAMADIGGEVVAVGQGFLQLGQVAVQRLAVGRREGGVSAGQGLAVGQDGLAVAKVVGRAAQGAVGL